MQAPTGWERYCESVVSYSNKHFSGHGHILNPDCSIQSQLHLQLHLCFFHTNYQSSNSPTQNRHYMDLFCTISWQDFLWDLSSCCPLVLAYILFHGRFDLLSEHCLGSLWYRPSESKYVQESPSVIFFVEVWASKSSEKLFNWSHPHFTAV